MITLRLNIWAWLADMADWIGYRALRLSDFANRRHSRAVEDFNRGFTQ